MVKMYSMNRVNYNKAKKIKFKNVARDFSKEVILLGKTPSGIRIGDIFASGPDGVKYQVRLVKYDKKRNQYMFNTGGSAFNSYYYKK